jgi:hypothetical protein
MLMVYLLMEPINRFEISNILLLELRDGESDIPHLADVHQRPHLTGVAIH